MTAVRMVGVRGWVGRADASRKTWTNRSVVGIGSRMGNLWAGNSSEWGIVCGC